MKRVRLLLVVPAAALAVLAAGCGGSGDNGPKPVPADAVAIVGDRPITRAEFDAMLAATRKGYREQGRAFPGPGTADYQVLRTGILDDFVQQAAFEQKAASDPGVVVTEADVDRRIADLKRASFGGSEARYRADLASKGLTELQMRARIRAQALAAGVFAKLSGKAKVSDADVEAYYNAHHTGYEQPATREARQISVRTRALADRLKRQLAGGADFAALVTRYSTDDATRAQGGRLPGGLTPGLVLPELVRAGLALKTREISAPVHTRNGWHIIQALSDMQPARVTPLAAVRETIRQLLLQQARQREMKTWVTATRAEYAAKTAYAPGFGPP